MTTPTLTATRTVLDRAPDHRSPTEAAFERLDEDGNRRTLIVERQTDIDLGSPDQVTITVEPGDRLNTAQAKD